MAAWRDDLTGDHKCGIIVAVIVAALLAWITYAAWDYNKYAKACTTPEFTARLLGLEEAR